VDTGVDRHRAIGAVSRETAAALVVNKVTHTLWILPPTDATVPLQPQYAGPGGFRAALRSAPSRHVEAGVREWGISRCRRPQRLVG
jgi:hypothetical protein